MLFVLLQLETMNIDFPLSQTLKTTKTHLAKLERMGISTIRDALEFFPRAIESTEISSDFRHIQLGVKQTVSGILTDVRKETTTRGKKIARAALTLNDGSVLDVIWFQIPYLLRNMRDESRVFLVGKIDRNYGKIQVSNPEIHLDRNVHIGALRAIYPESPPITSKWLREKITGLLVFVKEFSEILPHKILQSEKFMGKAEAIHTIHRPKDSESWYQARHRLGFEEIFSIQVRVMREKFLREKKTQNKYLVAMNTDQVKADIEKLPFELTTAQKKCLYQVLKDFEADKPMHRLMQGDVGSGKTIVAFLAGLHMARSRSQVAILAPTEILAKQHFANALKFFPSTMRVELLTGSVTAKNKQNIKNKLAHGDIQILIGTHALFTEDTVFKNLGLAVIDEQHRFGVQQRAILAQNNSHVLAMTATPIPRTLALTMYGDQDISVIDEMPAGRKSIITRVVHDEKASTLCYRFIDDQIEKGRQIFWVCPLIDESDKIEAKNVKHEFERINNELFPKRRVEFLHGKMKAKEKDAIMRRFRDHEFDILVSTSVIEVGVDIPNATVMVIENSERFGLSQLHQFRGRIGRNDMQSYCFLMVGKKDDAQKQRLRAMEKSNNGMYLAEVDLKLRGMGEIYGTRQSGLPDLKCADLTNLELLQKARDWAISILKEDVTLESYPALKREVERGEVYF